MNGPSWLRLTDGNSSMNGMKAGPEYHGQIELSTGSSRPKPLNPDTGMKERSLAGLKLSMEMRKLKSIGNVLFDVIIT